jgi:hypothetical protein
MDSLDNDKCFPVDRCPFLPSFSNPALNLFASITHPASKLIQTTVGRLAGPPPHQLPPIPAFHHLSRLTRGSPAPRDITQPTRPAPLTR